MTSLYIEPSSFRDPSGFIFFRNGKILRQVNKLYRANYDMLVGSGLYKELVDAELLVSHRESLEAPYEPISCYKVLEPHNITYISYPYEWCFSQIKDAALVTLKIQQIALQHGMSLKDSSAYNIQICNGKPLFIDTLSFEAYVDGSPWIAYRQFCQHFLAPLALMKYKDVRVNQLLKANIDGIPLDLAAKLLPFRSKLNFSILSHIVAHARSQKHFSNKQVRISALSLSKFQLTAIIDGLHSFISKLSWKPEGFEWGNYYNETNYSDESTKHKREIVKHFFSKVPQGLVYDIGGNNGTYSRLASDTGRETVCFDIDPAAVEKNYLAIKNNNERMLLPLIMDITNPSPGIGWGNRERKSFFERGKADTVMALALIHHLAISNNIPLERIAETFHGLCKFCIVEWIPKEDSQVQRLLSTRKDIFQNYTQEYFEACFERHFGLIDKMQISKTLRYLYLYKAK